MTRTAILPAVLPLVLLAGAGRPGADDGQAVLGQWSWHAEADRPGDLWLGADAGPEGGPALVARAFPSTSGRWVSQPIPVQAGRAYLFAAPVRPTLGHADARLELAFRGSEGKELRVFSSRWIFWHHDWAAYDVAGEAPEGSADVLLRLSVRGADSQSSGQVLMGLPSFGPSAGLAVSLAARGHILRPDEAAQARMVVSGVPDDTRLAASWRVLDFAGDPVPGAEGKADLRPGENALTLPPLGPGYYRLQVEATTPGLLARRVETSLGVIAELPQQPPADSPICLDAGISWSYPPDSQPERADLACYLCEFAGIRQLRDRLSWGEVEREQGKLDWRRYALAAETQQRHGITVYQIFHDCPGWAHPEVEGGKADGHYAPRDPIYAYRMVNRLVRDLCDKVRYFEVWNEPNIGFFRGHPWDYAAVLKAAYLGAKEADPRFGVLIGSAAGTPGGFFEGAYDNGAGDYFDIYNQHSYGSPEALFQFLADVREQLGRHGLGAKPMWITEMGLRGYPDARGDFAPIERDQASYLVRAYACALANGVAKFHYFYLKEYFEGSSSLWGILRDDLTPKPAFVALADLIRQLGEAQCLGWKRVGEKGYLVAFRRAPDEVVAVAWDPDSSELAVPARGPVLDVVGREIEPAGRPAGAAVTLGALPVFLRGIAPAGVEALGLEPPVPAPQYAADADPDLAAKRVFLQAETSPDRPQPPPAEMDRQKLAVPVMPGDTQMVRAWVNNYTDGPVRVDVRCEADEGLRVEGETTASVEAGPWSRGYHDFSLTARNVVQGRAMRARFLMMAGAHQDVACVQFMARASDIEPTERGLLFDAESDLSAWGSNHSPTVDVVFARDEAVAHGGKAALKVQTAIAADADAWVFPRLSLPGNVNLADYSAIELWSYVAPGGEAPPVLMLQLVEDGGGTWAISGLRSLAEPGWKRTLAMLDSAQPTSWGRDPDGKLDLSKVRTLLLGWGGYTGRPGEELTFWLDDIAAARW